MSVNQTSSVLSKARPSLRRARTVLAAAVIGAMILLAHRAAPAATLFASPTGGGAACDSPATPCTLCGAYAASAAGDTIYLAGGTYTGECGAAGMMLVIDRDLTLLGGWTGTAATPPSRGGAETVLDGENVTRPLTVWPGKTVLVDGLTISRGFNALSGGGILSIGADLTLANVTVSRCAADNSLTTADVAGGGVWIGGGSLLVRDSTFIDNRAECVDCAAATGGGLYLQDTTSAVVERTSFEANQALAGGGIHAVGTGAAIPLTIREATFGVNYGWDDWGAVVLSKVDATIVDTGFFNNRHGVLLHQGGSLVARRNKVAGNHGRDIAGFKLVGLAALTLENNAFTGNETDAALPNNLRYSAAVLEEMSTGAFVVRHNTFVGPDVPSPGTGLSISNVDGRQVRFQNNLFAHLVFGIKVLGISNLSFEGTLWGVGKWLVTDHFSFPYPNNTTVVTSDDFTGDPAFVKSAFPYHIGPRSPARNRAVADPRGPIPDDIDGIRRTGPADLGADEYVPKVRVGTPNGREVFPAGGVRTVRWDGPVTAKRYEVSSSLDGGTTWRRITKRAIAAKSLSWQIPRPSRNVRTALIQVVGRNAKGQVVGTDRSNRPFRIEVVRLVTPNGDKNLVGGTTQTVAWETNETRQAVNRVFLSYTTNGGRSWTPILPGPEHWNTGRATWTVPTLAAPATRCKLKVVLKDATGRTLGVDVSDTFFTIE